MQFAQSEYTFILWIALVLAVFLIWAHRKKKQLLYKFAEEKLLNEIAAYFRSSRQLIKSSFIVLAVVLCALALMRPQWGFQWCEVKRKSLDIIIAIDVSKSMLASDVKPNRLERSRLAVKDLLKKLQGDRIGLIAFSGTAFLQCPLTADYGGFSLALNDLDTKTIPYGGTSISSAIKLALRSYDDEESKYKILLIITDGENHEGNALAAAELARAEGVKIFSIGIGTAEGELIQVRDERGKRSFLKDRKGNVVKSRLNEELLQRIALITEGAYIRSSGAEFGLEYIYEQKLASMQRREIQAKMGKFYHERFQIPLALALALLIVEPFIANKKK